MRPHIEGTERLELDRRLVQTAVLGAAGSHDPVIMPMTRFEAKHFLDAHPGALFWCGTWLGGCGRKLTTRVGMERIPHFAHWPNPRGPRTVCHRLHNGRRSADHLFVSRDLSAWARGRGHRPAAPILHGDFQSGDTCTCLQITLRGGTGSGDGLITIVFKAYDLSDWRRREVALSAKNSWFNWVFGPGVVSPQELVDRDGYALHLRLDSTDGVSSIEIGTRPRKGGTKWVELDACTIEEHGISTPLAAEIRTEMRRKRTVLPTATPRFPAGVQVASGATVTLSRFRRALLRVGREYAMAGEMERAGLCARLGRETDHESPRLPSWLWTDVRKLLGAPAPVVPAPLHETRRGGRFPTGLTEFPAAPSLVQLDDVLDDISLDDRLVDFFAEVGCPSMTTSTGCAGYGWRPRTPATCTNAGFQRSSTGPSSAAWRSLRNGMFGLRSSTAICTATSPRRSASRAKHSTRTSATRRRRLRHSRSSRTQCISVWARPR
jgi:hypothetical protein